MSDQEFILAPATVSVDFDILAVETAMNSLGVLNQAEELSGLGEWVDRTWHAITPERRRLNLMVSGDLLHGFKYIPDEDSFPAYLQEIAQHDAAAARDKIVSGRIEYYLKLEDKTYEHLTPEDVLSDKSLYLHITDTLAQKHDKRDFGMDSAYYEEVYRLLQNPAQMRAFVLEHLTYMWENHLKDEWARNLPVLEACVRAFKQQDYTGMTALEAIRAVTGRDMSEHWGESLNKATRLTFLPSAHIGPYNAYFMRDDVTYLFFGTRMPRGARSESTALNRSELLVRLNALADDTRLTILELLTEHGELCAQDIINMLNLSQSSASRHLRQLTATGYLVERRRDVAKCYSINMERADDTLKALKLFLKR